MARKRKRARAQVVGGGGFGSGAFAVPGVHRPPAAGPVLPPAGYYDPALDAALSAAKRGFGDQQADYSRDFGTGQGGRLGNDYQLGLASLTQQRDRQLADLGTQRADVNLGYQRLGTSQAQGDRRAGVRSGGLLKQQLAIRAGNQQHDLAPIATAEQRVGQDFTTQRDQLGLGFQRAGEDASTGLQRSGREVGQFGIDTQASRLYQATQAGYIPPGGGSGSSKRHRRRRGMTVGRAGGPSFGAGAGGLY